MEEFSGKSPEAAAALSNADSRSVKRWLALYAGYLLALAGAAGVLMGELGVGWRQVLLQAGALTGTGEAALKLLLLALYLSVCWTFFPLPTAPLVAALATREVALSPHALNTTLLVATVGAAGSTIANLHDYHMITWMLRHRWVAQIRSTRLHRRASRWFARRPFSLLVVFNVLPIPIDVVRMLAATHQYPLRPFAAANFLGRWIRYATIAFVTFHLGPHGRSAVVLLLVATLVFGASKLVVQLRQRLAPAQVPADGTREGGP